MRITRRLILAALLPVALIWVVGAQSIIANEQMLRRSVAVAAKADAERLAHAFDRRLDADLAALTDHAHNPLILESLRGGQPVMLTLPAIVHEGRASAVVITNAEGRSLSPTTPGTFAADDWWTSAMEHRVAIDVTPDRRLALALRIDDGQTPVGVVCSSFPLDGLAETGAENAEATAAIIDAQDRPVIGDAPTLIPDLSRGYAFHEGALTSVAPIVGPIEFAGLGWTLIRRHDAEPLLAPAARFRAGAVGLCTLATVLSVGLSALLSLGLIRRISRLAEAARRIGDGDLDATADLTGADELARLSADIDEMAASIRAAQAAYLEKVDAAEQKSDSLQREISTREATERTLRSYADKLAGAKRDLEVQALEIEQARAAAQAASDAKSEFVANMSHEIRTPMSAILSYAEYLLDEGLDAADAFDHVNTIQRNGRHLLAIINDVLDLSKLEAGKMNIERVEFSLLELIADVVALTRVRAAEKGVELSVEFLSPVPTHINSDPTRIRQILINLIGNAVKFTEQGSVRISLECDDRNADQPRLHIRVADTGIGMDEDLIRSLFTPFSQGDASMSRRYGGTGLGLTISRRLADALGGDISVTSSKGQGSTFTFAIAVGELRHTTFTQSIDDMHEIGRAGAADARALPQGAGRVLLAEDGPDNQRLIRLILSKAGYDVTVVENGKLAVDAALHAPAPYDVILMDMQMPEMDGYTATAALRSAGYTGAIVALTAHAMSGDRQRCLAAGCDAYETKPIDRLHLLEIVAACCIRRQAA